MKYVVYSVLLLLTLVLQTAGVPGLVFFGFKPELMLLLSLIFAMILEPGAAAVFGFAAGLAQDLVVGRFIMLHAGVFMVVALALGYAIQRFYRENIIVRFIALFLGTGLGEVLYLLGAASFGLSMPWRSSTWLTILAVSFFNGLVGALVYRPLSKLNRHLIYLDELVKRTG
ncbi:MAG TPA: rod shape-determining protein MreD [Firmicutes bacterium]|jgi:rod shape-determining protein MreD|nr:rod shape-determining protein MreD [Bacillota bacterium]HHT43385.1 rod shape-determining protein MreD [Bacillota bacterium]